MFLSFGLVIEAHGALVDAVCLNSVPPSKPTGVICTGKPGFRVSVKQPKTTTLLLHRKIQTALDRNSEEEPVKHFSQASSKGCRVEVESWKTAINYSNLRHQNGLQELFVSDRAAITEDTHELLNPVMKTLTYITP